MPCIMAEGDSQKPRNSSSAATVLLGVALKPVAVIGTLGVIMIL